MQMLYLFLCRFSCLEKTSKLYKKPINNFLFCIFLSAAVNICLCCSLNYAHLMTFEVSRLSLTAKKQNNPHSISSYRQILVLFHRRSFHLRIKRAVHLPYIHTVRCQFRRDVIGMSHHTGRKLHFWFIQPERTPLKTY